MTNAELLAKIKAEIERLKNQLVRGACAAQIEMETNCKEEAYDEVLSFLNAIETEEPVPNDLEEAAKKYATEYHENPDGSAWKPYFEESAIKAFIAGADWQKEQMMKEAVEGTVYGNGVYTWVAGDIPSQFKYGDKVRVIVLPKED